MWLEELAKRFVEVMEISATVETMVARPFPEP
jgi:hypothetical protein